MSQYRQEIDAVQGAIARARPNDPKGIYAVPWYLVVGEPGSGRTTMVRSMNLTWPPDADLRVGLAVQLCNYWMSNEALFVEPTASVIGPRRDPQALRALCEDLRNKRPREPVDGVLLMVRVSDFIDKNDEGIDEFAHQLRSYLIEVNKYLRADIPTYVVVTGYDNLWGFGDVFQWTAERSREEAWGILLPPNTPSQQAGPVITELMRGLAARFEGYCLAKLSSNAPADERTRAFQHLVEARVMLDKLNGVMQMLARANAYERAPWVRALTVGSAVPSTGDRIRASMERFANMGLVQAAPTQQRRPGGLPVHGYMRDIVLPERELVPLRVRWRDDLLTVIAFALGMLLLLGATGWYIAIIAGQ